MTTGYDTSIYYLQSIETYAMPLDGGVAHVYIQEGGRHEMEELHKRYYKDHQELKDANLTIKTIQNRLGVPGVFDAEKVLHAITLLKISAGIEENTDTRENK